jgi:protein O-mannosyl-transferase
MDERRKKEHWLSVVTIVIITFLFYGNTLWNNYSGDDGVFITNNSITMSGLARTREIITDDGVLKGWLEKDKTTVEENGFRKRYRPLSQLTFAAEVQFFGLKPHISHFFNVLFYGIIAVLIFVIFSRLTSNLNNTRWFLTFPFLLTVIFILHPIHTEVVANIKSRDELLALLFALLSLYFTVKYFDNYRFKFLCLSFVTFFLALLSKENAITFLAIIPLTVYFFVNDVKENNRKKILSYVFILLPLILSTALFLIIRNKIIGPFYPDSDKSIFNNYFVSCNLSQKYGVIFYSLGKYLQLLVFPNRLMCDYSIFEVPIINFTNLLSLGSLCICVMLVIYAVVRMKSRSIVPFGILFYFAALSIYSNLVFSSGTAVAERFLFIPSLGFCIILSYYLSRLFNAYFKGNNYKIVIPVVLLLVIISFYGFRTVKRNAEWKDWKTLYKADLNRPNNCARLNKIYAELYFDGKNDKSPDFINKVKTAKKYYQRAIQIYPGYVDAINMLAICYYRIDKNYDSTIYYFLQSLRLDRNQMQIYRNIANVLDKKNDNEYSVKIFKELVNLNSIQPILNYLLGKALLKNNDIDSAAYYMEKAVGINYNYSHAVSDLISLYENKNYRLKNDYATYFRLSQLYDRGKKDSAKTLYYLEKAIEKDPNQSEAFYSVGTKYYYAGKKIKALDAFKKANRLAPDNLDVLRYIIKIYSDSGDSANLEKYNKIFDRIHHQVN